MIRRFAALLFVGFLAWLMTRGGLGTSAREGAEAAFMVGFVLLAAHLFGILGEQARLPRITGYIFAGILVGPFLLDLLDAHLQENLQIFKHMAYAFIGLAAGAELRTSSFRRSALSAGLQLTFPPSFAFAGVTLAAFLLLNWVPFAPNMAGSQKLALAVLFGVMATPSSPACAIAVISENRARGPFTEMILGVTMAKDLLVIPLFYVILSISRKAILSEQGGGFEGLAVLLAQLLASLCGGAAIGWLLSIYLRWEGPQAALVVVGVCFVVYKLSEFTELYLMAAHGMAVHLEPLLICAAAGFAVRNFFGGGDRLSVVIDNIGLPVYVVFFTLAGSGLDLGAVAAAWGVALALIGVRILTVFTGSWLGARIAGDPPLFRRYYWMGFITQAGLSIALASQVGNAFPGWGARIASLMVAVIAINELAGPVLLQISLDRVGETRMARRAGIRAAVSRRSP